MLSGIRTWTILGALILLATSTLAEVTITTDKPAYLTGEIVQITIHNNGPLGTDFNSNPFISIYNADIAECLYGCIGLAVMTPFPAGATEIINYDTNEYSDPAGTYSVFVNMIGLPNFTQYTVTGGVSTEALSWSAIKALYRD